ncbi:tRNA (adenosine(37)-N6)-dimethylallyltransferase MiaA [Tellurirhabdus bombi]|uniref:tRNA (adenosine(37)-N6)-dimethylallyltransferase MiaA n=1 Tax=Tellurirhabdus bombi TaxID=2907205 RepID=UPI001F030263|nr:tRNA (adenosine(37)-N6)-dimethylallyltransferase MiaA [Tellurirhabdus bombi]
MTKTLLVVAGPTAVGKTALCVQLAKDLQTAVVSADSRQLYRELTIGTAKPSPEEMQGVPHYFINSHSITDLVGAGHYEREALAVLDQLFQEKEIVILSGGTGLYINAVCFGLDDMPQVDPAIRQELMQRLEKEGLEPLQQQLRELDPTYAQTADLQNTQRVIRALEVGLAAGKPFSSFRRKESDNQQGSTRPFRAIFIALDRPREELYARIDHRMNIMLANGLVDEVRSLTPYRHLNALQTVGYKEVFDYLDGTYDEQKMVELLKRNSRRYAKRQLTWFRHQGDYRWFQADHYQEILDFVEKSRTES